MDAVQLLVSLLNLKFVCSETGRRCHYFATLDRREVVHHQAGSDPFLYSSVALKNERRYDCKRAPGYITLVTTVASRPSSL